MNGYAEMLKRFGTGDQFSPHYCGPMSAPPSSQDADIEDLAAQCLEAAERVARAQIPHMVEKFIIKEDADVESKEWLRAFGSWASLPDEDEEDAT